MEDYIVKKKPLEWEFPNINCASFYDHKIWKPVIASGLIKCSHCRKSITRSQDAISLRGLYAISLELETGLCEPGILHRKCAWSRYLNPSKPDHLPDPNTDCGVCVADFYEELHRHLHLFFWKLSEIKDPTRIQKELDELRDDDIPNFIAKMNKSLKTKGTENE